MLWALFFISLMVVSSLCLPLILFLSAAKVILFGIIFIPLIFLSYLIAASFIIIWALIFFLHHLLSQNTIGKVITLYLALLMIALFILIIFGRT